jgi:hypothetical protein
MPYLLRGIKKPRWYREVDFEVDEADAPAEPLRDLGTQGNALSVWLVDEAKSNLERVVAAMAAGRQGLVEYDYILFDQELVEAAGIAVDDVEGNSPDLEANRIWHRHLKNLTVRKMGKLVTAAWRSSEIGRFQRSRIRSLVKHGLEEGSIVASQVHENVLAKIRSSP